MRLPVRTGKSVFFTIPEMLGVMVVVMFMFILQFCVFQSNQFCVCDICWFDVKKYCFRASLIYFLLAEGAGKFACVSKRVIEGVFG